VSGDWSLIFRGFFVAGIGTASTILYIVAVSAAFVGRFAIASVAVVLGVFMAVTFLRLIGGYLDAIDLREANETAHMQPHGESSEAGRTSPAES
jgi:hypothetical protein